MTLMLRAIGKHFGGFVALQEFDLTVSMGEVVALIGPNGSGKTTVLNCVTGVVQQDHGEICWMGGDLTRLPVHTRAQRGIRRTFQELRVFASLSVLENVLLELSADDETFWRVFRRRTLQRRHARHIEEARLALDSFGLDIARNRLAGELSYGQRRLVDLARALVSKADLFLLDEPTAGVAPTVLSPILEAIDRLRRSGRAVLFIEHNFDTLDVADRVILMDAGRKLIGGPPLQVRRDPLTAQVYFGRGA